MFAAFRLTTSEGTWIIGGATLILALATFLMARQTKHVASSSQDEAEAVRQQTEAVLLQVEESRAALQASIRPWLTNVPGSRGALDLLPSDNSFRMGMKVRNVGNGIALMKPDGIKILSNPRRPAEPVERWGIAASSVVEPGAQTGIAFVVEGHGASIADFSGKLAGYPEELVVLITYTDNEGQQACIAGLRARVDSKGFWRFHQIDYTREGDSAAFASVKIGVGHGND